MTAQKIEITAVLNGVTKMPDGKFCFRVADRANADVYRFLLSKKKALKLANGDYEFPTGHNLRLRGRKNPSSTLSTLTFVKIIAVDGHDVQSWAESHKSPTVAPDVLTRAKISIDAAEAEAMRRRAPPEPAPLFKTPAEAYEKAMYLLRRQVRLKDPKLSKSDIWAIRDALNMLKKSAGL
jgi:hypothetical protein